MAATINEFREIMDQEVSVDLQRLREISVHGIPDKIRAEVWKYLLGCTKADKIEEIRNSRMRQQEYEQMDKTIDSEKLKSIRGTMKRYLSNEKFLSESVSKKLEKIIGAYLNYNTDLDYKPDWIFLLLPFIQAGMTSESDIFWSFDSFMTKKTNQFSEPQIRAYIAKFQLYFCSFNSSLFNFFEEEELSPNDFAILWLQTFLAKELPKPCHLRLWDTYFSRRNGFRDHLYVCLAILSNLAEELQELQEISDIKNRLQHLPQMDIDELLVHAENIKQEIQMRT